MGKKRSSNEYYTGTGTGIDKLLESGATVFFTDLIIAMEHARQIRSYYYQVFDSKRKHCGYAVPK